MPPFMSGSRFRIPGYGTIAIFLIVGALLFAVTGCATIPADVARAPATPAERTALNLEIHDAVWALVRDKHFDPHYRGIDWNAMRTKYRDAAAAARDEAELYGILARLCDELKESHLVPLPPRRTQEIRSARRMAVGMGWTTLDGRQVVTDIVPGGPAEAAGVEPGWIVLSCEGQPVTAARTPAPGRPVTYGFLDLRNEARLITFQPQLLKTARLVSEPLPGGGRYLRFDHFNRESVFWLNRELRRHRQAPAVVLDLRDNPGGYLFSAKVAIAQFFTRRVSAGRFVHRSGRVSEGRGWPILSARYRGDVVILTGPETGSAAEIFAHVLQHERRATLVGRRTAGAVVVSRTYGLPGGGTLQVPIQDYRGRDGRRLEGVGVGPDVTIDVPDLADLRRGRDPDLQAALASLGLSRNAEPTLAVSAVP